MLKVRGKEEDRRRERELKELKGERMVREKKEGIEVGGNRSSLVGYTMI